MLPSKCFQGSAWEGREPFPSGCARRSRWPLYAVSLILASVALGRLAAWSPATTGRTGDCRTAGNAGDQHYKQHLTNEERQPLQIIVVNHCKQLLVGLQSPSGQIQTACSVAASASWAALADSSSCEAAWLDYPPTLRRRFLRRAVCTKLKLPRPMEIKGRGFLFIRLFEDFRSGQIAVCRV